MACRLADAAREVHARGKPDIRRVRRHRRNELWEEHVSARPIRYLAAIALWALPDHAGAQSPATAAPEVLRVTPMTAAKARCAGRSSATTRHPDACASSSIRRVRR